MEHPLFLRKPCAALKLYEKRDLADREVVEVLQAAGRLTTLNQPH